jgi:predicted ATPase
MILRGWALIEHKQGAEAIRQIQQGLMAWRASGSEHGGPFWLALLVEAYGHMGQTEEALNVLAEALALVNKNGDCHWEAELYRLKGKLLLLGQSTAQAMEAEACFRQALDVARRQQAKSLELRAAMSLSRLWQRQENHAAARELLAEIYGWFTEGFDTADLQEAKDLLATLS